MLQDGGLAEDATQEVFIKVWKNFSKVDEQFNPKAWLFKIARNTTIDILRKKKNITFSMMETEEQTFAETIKDDEPLAYEVFENKEKLLEIENILSQIDPELKEIIILHDTEGLTFKELSEVLGRPLNTIKSQYRRVLHQIRSKLRI